MNTNVRTPVVLKVLFAVTTLLVLGLAVLLTPDDDVAPPSGGTVGVQELIRITGPNGRTVEAIARIDTGATASALDEEIAKGLGFDLDNAETVTVVSSLGRDKRPVVEGALQMAGTAKTARFTVADRSKRSNPVLLGRADLQNYQVQVGQRMLTTPGEQRAPSALATLMSEAPALNPLQLLALLPLAALVIVLLRVFVGVETLGTFSPVLLAIGYTQSGLVAGLALTVLIIAAGFLAQPLLRRLRLPRVARLAVLVSLVSVVLVSVFEVAGGGNGAIWGTALPVVVTAVVVERLWETWDLDGWPNALRLGATTTAVALVVTGLLLAPVVRDLASTAPLALATACAVWAALAGTYRGLRLSELLRFRVRPVAGATSRTPTPAEDQATARMAAASIPTTLMTTAVNDSAPVPADRDTEELTNR